MSKLYNKRVLLILGVVTAVIACSLFVHLQSQSPVEEPSDSSDTINYDPPTEAERRSGDENKARITDANQTDKTQSTTKNEVNPVISAWTQDEAGDIRINGFVQGVIEKDGTCKYTLKQLDQTIIRSRTGMINAQDTTCGQIIIKRGDLNQGQWQATLHYTSLNSEGVSSATIIDVE